MGQVKTMAEVAGGSYAATAMTYYDPDNFTGVVLANRAVHETLGRLSNGRGNLTNDIIASGAASTEQTGVARNAQRTPATTVLQWVAQNAIAAVQAKAGNCGECAAVAFCLLHGWKVGPIALCSASGADHAFCLIKTTDEYIVVDPWAFKKDPDTGRILNDGLGRLRTLSQSKPIYANPNIVIAVDRPDFDPMERFADSIEEFDSMEYQYTNNTLVVEQLLSDSHTWTGI